MCQLAGWFKAIPGKGRPFLHINVDVDGGDGAYSIKSYFVLDYLIGRAERLGSNGVAHAEFDSPKDEALCGGEKARRLGVWPNEKGELRLALFV